MATKTKNDLIKEIENLNKELAAREADLRQCEELAACSELSERYKKVYDSYVSAGFTKDQALTILTTIIERTVLSYMSEATHARYNRRYYR